MSQQLTDRELKLLIERVFVPSPADTGLAIMVDLPDEKLPDNHEWAQRRSMAVEWARQLHGQKDDLELEQVNLVWYRNCGSNNADLPQTCVLGDLSTTLDSADILAGMPAQPFNELFAHHSLIMAPTELSATAPLKVAARGQSFRAATMPGFLPSMIPALKIDYNEVNRRVLLLKELCDPAETAYIVFKTPQARHELQLDLRFHAAHASGGIFPDNGIAGNLPSGETYIVPYEGERPGERSRSTGELPVQFGTEIVLYRIEENRAVEVLSTGPDSEMESKLLKNEPAYANLAELGLGVLGDFGLEPTGSILLDEKLGLHIAFGRSDHFGGSVGPDNFSSPESVIHLDRVYIRQTQPFINVQEVRLTGPDLDRVIIENDSYTDLFQ